MPVVQLCGGLFCFNSTDNQTLNRVLKNTFKKYEEMFGWYCVILLPLTKKAAKAIESQTKKFNTMTTITNQTGSKAVNIRENGGNVIAQYVQFYEEEQQVLQSKSFSTKAAAKRWANKILA